MGMIRTLLNRCEEIVIEEEDEEERDKIKTALAPCGYPQMDNEESQIEYGK